MSNHKPPLRKHEVGSSPWLEERGFVRLPNGAWEYDGKLILPTEQAIQLSLEHLEHIRPNDQQDAWEDATWD